MASSIDNNGNFNVSSADIQLRANSGGVPLSHDDVDSNFENLRLGHNAVVTALAGKASSSHAHDLATAGNSGFMSSTMFSKLDGIDNNANNYSLEPATAGDLGGVKIGDNININSGKISVPVATSAIPGVVEYDDSTIKKNNSGQLYVDVSAVNTNTTYDDGSGLDLVGTTFSHANTSSQADIALGSRTYINGLTFDAFGHVTGFTSASETVVNTDTNTTYTADGVGITLSGTQFKHADTSSANSVNNSGNTVIQDITIDQFGHITGLVSKTVETADTTVVMDQGSWTAKGLERTDTARGDAGTISLGNTEKDYTSGVFTSVNDVRPLNVYINAVQGTPISTSYGQTVNGSEGNGVFWGETGPRWRGIISDPNDMRYRAVPEKFPNWGQAEAYVNRFHPAQSHVRYIFETDVTETLYNPVQYDAESNAILDASPPKKIDFINLKAGAGNETTGPYSSGRVVRWNITFYQHPTNGHFWRNYIIDARGTDVYIANFQFDIQNPQWWLFRQRHGSALQLHGYVGYRVNGNFKYGMMTAEGGSMIYDLSYGDILQTNVGQWGDGTLYHYEATSNAHIAQYGSGQAAYIWDGKVGCAKLHDHSNIVFKAHDKAHSGSADPGVPGFADGNTLPSVYWDYDNDNNTGANKEEIYLQYGPYIKNNRATTTVAYDILTETEDVPAILFGGVGCSWDWGYRPGNTHLETEPIAKNSYKYSQMPGNKTWNYASPGHNVTAQWDPTAYGFDATTASMINHPLFGSRPLHTDQYDMPTPHKFRSLAVYPTGATHGSVAKTNQKWGNYYEADFYANGITNVPTW